MFYRRNEFAFRLAIFYGASAVAGAFSGLLAFGVFQIHDSKIAGWKYLFIIEGGVSIILASFALWYLPENALTCDWFTEEEKAVAKQRLMLDGSMEVNEQFKPKEALRALLDWRIVTYAIMGLSYGVGTNIRTTSPNLHSVSGKLTPFSYSKCISLELSSTNGPEIGM
jgi:MFS family permease